jgi:hypothetical protein
MILDVVPGHGPSPDCKHFRPAITEARRRVRIVTLAADAGYDSEASHEYARQECGIRTLIPALQSRPTSKRPSGYWRRQMQARLHTTRYGQRWQVETVNSMIKRLLDSALRARKRWNQYREIVLRALTLNVMIVRWLKVFYRAAASPFRCPIRKSCCKRISKPDPGRPPLTSLCDKELNSNQIAFRYRSGLRRQITKSAASPAPASATVDGSGTEVP